MLVACFDIGGTAVKAALINQEKEMVYRDQQPTPADLDALLAWMDTVIRQEEGVTAISLSVPGSVNQATGVIEGISAVSYIHQVSWYTLLSDYQLPITMENDANCVGLSELAHQKTLRNFACVVCGTGIGGAVLIERKLLRGHGSYGGEFGYMIIDGLSTPLKNWSQLASTGSLVRRVQEEKGEAWDGKRIFVAASKGDKVCQTAIHEMTQQFAIGLMNIFYNLAPEKIVIGGAISQNERFLQLVKEQLDNLVATYPDFPVAPEISACYYKQDANLMGAFMNALGEE